MKPILFQHAVLGLRAAVFSLPMALLLGADDAKNAGTQSGQLSMLDEKFVINAAQGGMTEVKLGELAKQKGKRDDVKAFGDLMIADHGKTNDELKALALKKGTTLPEQLDAGHAGVIDRLATLEGDQFDKAYIDEMVKDHKNDVSDFKLESKSAKDADLKAFVTKTLPTLQRHLEHIKNVEAGRPK